MPGTFSVEELYLIRQPIPLLTGDQHRLNPPWAIEGAKRTFQHLEAGIILHAGHYPSIEQPEDVDAQTVKFLTEG